MKIDLKVLGNFNRYVNFVGISSTLGFMSDLTEIVDNLENRVNRLLHKYDVLKQSRQTLEEELTAVKKENLNLSEEIKNFETKVQTLKAANAILGSNDYKKETKLKINGLIREIDQCIVQLSE